MLRLTSSMGGHFYNKFRVKQVAYCSIKKGVSKDRCFQKQSLKKSFHKHPFTPFIFESNTYSPSIIITSRFTKFKYCIFFKQNGCIWRTTATPRYIKKKGNKYKRRRGTKTKALSSEKKLKENKKNKKNKSQKETEKSKKKQINQVTYPQSGYCEPENPSSNSFSWPLKPLQ